MPRKGLNKGDKMNITVDNIEVKNRLKFKNDIKSLTKAIVLFKGDKASIIINKPYVITEEALIELSRAKKAVYNYINEFRQYQFNQ